MEELPKLAYLKDQTLKVALMPRSLSKYSIVAAILCLGLVPSVGAQICRAANDSSVDMIQMVKNYALATDSAMKVSRDFLLIPAVASAADVALITKEVTCKSANSAYQKAATGARQTLSGRVFVVKVGTSYVVWDPAYRFHASYESWLYMLFDSRWVLKSHF